MKTIKVIDLLNKVLNGEELPKKIKIRGYWFKLSDNYKDYNINYVYEDNFDNYWLDNVRVDEDVMMEEENKGVKTLNEEIDMYDYTFWESEFQTCTDLEKKIIDNIGLLMKKQDELIKVVNELKKGK